MEHQKQRVSVCLAVKSNDSIGRLFVVTQRQNVKSEVAVVEVPLLNVF